MDSTYVTTRKRKNVDENGEIKTTKRKKKITPISNGQFDLITNLLDRYGRRYYKSSGIERAAVVDEMIQNLQSESGTIVTASDLKTRLKGLKNQYASQKSRAKKGDRITWMHFDNMKRILDPSSENESSSTSSETVEVQPDIPQILFTNEHSSASEDDQILLPLNLSTKQQTAVFIKMENISTSYKENIVDNNATQIFPLPAHHIQTSHKTNPFFFASNNNNNNYNPIDNQRSPSSASVIDYKHDLAELRLIVNDLVTIQNSRQNMDSIFNSLLKRANDILKEDD